MLRIISILSFVTAGAVATGAQAQDLTPTQTYVDYRQAYLDGETYGEISGFLAPDVADAVDDSEKEMLFEFVQSIVKDSQGIKYLTESVDGDTAAVTGEVCMDGTMTGIYVDLILDAGQWKILKDHWDNSGYMVPSKDDPNMKIPQKC